MKHHVPYYSAADCSPPGLTWEQGDRRFGGGRLATVELEVDHPELAAYLFERDFARDLGFRLTGLHVALAGSCPDLAISLWLRFREVHASVLKSVAVEQAIVHRQHIWTDRPGGEPLDPTPEALADKPGAIEALGRWRACLHFLLAARCGSTRAATPSSVLQSTRDSIVAHVSDLDATIRRLATAAVLDRDHEDVMTRVEAIFSRAKGCRVAIRAVVLRST